MESERLRRNDNPRRIRYDGTGIGEPNMKISLRINNVRMERLSDDERESLERTLRVFGSQLEGILENEEIFRANKMSLIDVFELFSRSMGWGLESLYPHPGAS